MPPHLGVKYSENANFGGTNRHFQTKWAKSKIVHIIKTTAPIQIKFCKAIKKTKYSSLVVQKRA